MIRYPDVQQNARRFERTLKERVAQVVFAHGTDSSTQIKETLEADPYFGEISAVAITQTGTFEHSIKVQTQHSGSYWFRLILKAEA